MLYSNSPLGVFLHHLSFLQEQEFLQKQQQELDSALKKIIQQHKHELATTERDCLNHKQQLLRGNKVWLIKCESCMGGKKPAQALENPATSPQFVTSFIAYSVVD